MSNGISLLARLFRKQPATSFTAELHARAINTPLFINAGLGAQLINAYLHGPQPQAKLEGEEVGRLTVRTDNGIAVMDISGAMTSRPVYSWCSQQVSYEQIRTELAEQVSDANTSAIVLRLDTPGGEAAQNIDLADFIYSMRGDKPIIAMVDDMAYSAGYAIASACDEIWITRTGGVGSVGVVTYHIDQSELNSKIGIKVEFIHAGAKKVQGNPHQSLSDEARSDTQVKIDYLYDMFCESVARGRGLSVEAVKATEAGCYIGTQAIEVGFADTLGTFSELLDYLGGGEKPQQPTKAQTIEQVDDEPEVPNEPQQTDGEPGDVEELEGESQEEVSDEPLNQEHEEEKMEALRKAAAEPQSLVVPEPTSEATLEDKRKAEIRAVCTAAGIPDIAQDFITAGTAVEQVRTDLVAMLNAGEVEIESKQSVQVDEQPEQTENPLNASQIYAARRANRL